MGENKILKKFEEGKVRTLMKAEIVESKETKSGKRCCTVTCLRTEYDSETQEIDTVPGSLKRIMQHQMKLWIVIPGSRQLTSPQNRYIFSLMASMREISEDFGVRRK